MALSTRPSGAMTAMSAALPGADAAAGVQAVGVSCPGGEVPGDALVVDGAVVAVEHGRQLGQRLQRRVAAEQVVFAEGPWVGVLALVDAVGAGAVPLADDDLVQVVGCELRAVEMDADLQVRADQES